MKDTKDHDIMYQTFIDQKGFKNKDKRKEYKEIKEKEFEEEWKKRDFCVTMRPPFIWNFYGEEEEKVEHLINPEANPEICYKYEENN